MKDFIRGHTVLVVVFVLLLLWALTAPLIADKLVAPPVLVPLKLSPAGEVRACFWIPLGHLHELSLLFLRAGHDFDDMEKRLGDSWYRGNELLHPGTNVPLRWTVTRANGTGIASAETDTFGITAWAAEYMGRHVADVPLEAGAYELRVEVLRDVPELADLDCRLALAIHPWEEGFGIFVDLLFRSTTYLIVWPAMIILALVLAVLAFRRRRRRQAA